MSLRVSNNNGYTIGYDDGINYADGRVNTNSINYQSGYNSGISYADSRVNTSSINYSTGYNNGINYADGRVNTSSSSYTTGYNSGYSKGKNIISTLTSGERFLIGIVGQTIRTGFCLSREFYQILDLPGDDTELIMTNVNSITMTCKFGSSGVAVAAFGTSVTYEYNHPSQTVTFNPANGHIVVYNPSYNGYVPEYVHYECSITITSFTTTDGKVHTASNLNY